MLARGRIVGTTHSDSKSASMSAFLCDICKQGFAEKYNLIHHVKNQHGWTCHHLIGVIIMKCLFKTTGKWSGGHLDTTSSPVGGALNGTVNEYCLNLQDEQQDASNVLDVLKESTFQVENRINKEVVKKRAIKFYLSLHVNFHLSTDVAFLTDQQFLVLIPLKCMTCVMYMMH